MLSYSFPGWPALQLPPQTEGASCGGGEPLGRLWEGRNQNPTVGGKEGRGEGREAVGIFFLASEPLYPALISFSPGGLTQAGGISVIWPGNLGGLEAWQRALQNSFPEPLQLMTLSQALMVNLGSDRFIRQVRAHCRTTDCPRAGNSWTQAPKKLSDTQSSQPQLKVGRAKETLI